MGEILAKHDRRKDIFLATKLPITRCLSIDDVEKFFNEQLRRLQTDYIDYYFMHNIAYFGQWETLQELGIEQWIADKKESGQIGQVGFSYHGNAEDFLKLIDAYSWEFCLIQHNYYDPNYQAGSGGLQAAAAKGITVMIMEPLLGGQLATGLPAQAEAVFKKLNPDLTPADWALWWLWNKPEVTTVLSGMSSAAIVESNLRSIDKFRPLDEKELAAYDEVVEIFRQSYKVNCTSCNYCLPCPKGINIPACISAYNTSYIKGFITGMTLYLTSTAAVTKNPTSPRLCNQCGKCEKACPQHIEIRSVLKKVGGRFESLPLRALLAIVRKVMSR